MSSIFLFSVAQFYLPLCLSLFYWLVRFAILGNFSIYLFDKLRYYQKSFFHINKLKLYMYYGIGYPLFAFFIRVSVFFGYIKSIIKSMFKVLKTRLKF